MLIIQLKKGESIEKALKRYKRKYQKTKVHQQLRDGKAFTKPSVKRRKEKENRKAGGCREI